MQMLARLVWGMTRREPSTVMVEAAGAIARTLAETVGRVGVRLALSAEVGLLSIGVSASDASMILRPATREQEQRVLDRFTQGDQFWPSDFGPD